MNCISSWPDRPSADRYWTLKLLAATSSSEIRAAETVASGYWLRNQAVASSTSGRSPAHAVRRIGNARNAQHNSVTVRRLVTRRTERTAAAHPGCPERSPRELTALTGTTRPDCPKDRRE